MYAARPGIDHLRQFVGVGAAQLGHAAVVEDQTRQFVLVGNGFQRFLVGGWRTGRGFQFGLKAEFIEQQRSELFGRVQIEMPSGDFIGRILHLQHACREVGALAPQQRSVNQYAVLLDVAQDLLQRDFHIAVQRFERRRLL